jgi:hypothetical protein
MNPVQSPHSNREMMEQGSFGGQGGGQGGRQGGRQRGAAAQGRTSKWLALPGLAILCVSFYWMFTYSGPYRSLAEWQLKWLGSYSPDLTLVLIAMGLLVGLLAIAKTIKLIFRGAERPISEMPTPPISRPAVGSSTTPAPTGDVAVRWLQSFRLAMIYVAPLIVVGLGAFSYYNGTREGNLQQLSAADFETGKVEARALYADVHGHLSQSYISDDDSYAYIPMLSEEKAVGPVRLMVGINSGDMQKYLHREADGAVSVRGVADKGLPSDLRYAFEKNGVAVADPVWVVHAGRNPSSDRKTGVLVMGFGAVLGVFLIGWQSYRKRKRQTAQAVRATA